MVHYDKVVELNNELGELLEMKKNDMEEINSLMKSVKISEDRLYSVYYEMHDIAELPHPPRKF